jgi:hypothetical protein
LLLFGGEVLLAYFEPIRLYVAVTGVLIVFGAFLRELTMVRRTGESTVEQAGTERTEAGPAIF